MTHKSEQAWVCRFVYCFVKWCHIRPPLRSCTGASAVSYFHLTDISTCSAIPLFFFPYSFFLFPVPSLPLPVVFCIFTGNWSHSSPTVSNQLPFWSTMPRYRDIRGHSYTHTDTDTVTRTNKEKISTFWKMSFFLCRAFSILLGLSTGADMCRYAYVQSCAHTDSQIAQQTEWH